MWSQTLEFSDVCYQTNFKQTDLQPSEHKQNIKDTLYKITHIKFFPLTIHQA